MPGKLRIIGGKWRSRKIDVINVADLRPTPDRVRETLFNWLAPSISGARCLDLYAGTGTLGFEALSRGAASVVMVEHNKSLAHQLEHQALTLEANNYKICCMSVSDWLNICHDTFDIIFLDPPYNANLARNNIMQLLNCGCMKQGTQIYIESGNEVEEFEPCIQLKKSGKAGLVQYRLFSYV
ncbi:MAG: 16S rRNA (guanine(966)-N(2))-methyltransferase RsmD [Gammaproteobacteria bacterium]